MRSISILPTAWRIPFVISVLVLLASLQGCGAAEEEEEAAPVAANAIDPSITESIIRGGLLYDNWMAELELSEAEVPVGVNPYWLTGRGDSLGPSGSAVNTWRCQQCHGWDYKGVEGAYGLEPETNPNYSNFGGIIKSQVKTEAEILAVLTDGYTLVDPATKQVQAVHNFGAYLSANNLRDLVAFIKMGVIDSAPYIKKLENGQWMVENHSGNGVNLYTTDSGVEPNANCSICHGDNGAGVEDVDLGELARQNPWLVLHKIRFGNAGPESPEMPSGLEIGLTDANSSAVLAHTMTLIVESNPDESDPDDSL